MPAVTGQMNIDTAASATPQTSGLMIVKLQTGDGFMELSEPAAVSGLMQITDDSGTGSGFMQIKINA